MPEQMKTKILVPVALMALNLLLAGSASSAPATSAFSYQGRLFDAGSPANGRFEIQFSLWDQIGGGSLIGSPVLMDPVGVTNGLFQVDLDFGTNVWNGSSRWLQVSVRPDNSPGPFTTLNPRQQVNAAPHAVLAQRLTAPLGGDQLSGTYPQQIFFQNPGNVFAGQGSGLTGLNAAVGTGRYHLQGGVSTDTAPFCDPIVPFMVIDRNAPPHSVTVSWLPHVPGYVLEFTDTLNTPRWFPFNMGSSTELTVREKNENLFFRLRRVITNP